MYREFVGKSYRIVDAVFFFDLIDDERTSCIIDTFCVSFFFNRFVSCFPFFFFFFFIFKFFFFYFLNFLFFFFLIFFILPWVILN